MLHQDEFLIVMKCEQLSAGLVPQVAPEKLDSLRPHEYVRVLFELDWILADDVAEELEPLLSKNGKIFAMSSTNRIEAMDAVVNLQQINEVLQQEQSDSGQDRLVREFVLKHTSAKLTKICNDLRLLASGPRCGFNEINLPQMQPGSSIMPGKVNPVIPEVVNQVGFLVIGLDLTVTLAASAGQLQLNVMEPVITFALFTSIATMENAVNSLRVNCVQGITANAERTRDMVLNSLGIVTVLKPSLGYKQCAEIAREGYETGKSLHDIVVKERKLLTQEKW
jgi:aspartate ammonia-lyase